MCRRLLPCPGWRPVPGLTLGQTKGKGRGPADAVWRAACRSEAEGTQGGSGCILREDSDRAPR
eukprot:2019189-Prorocentrum_lima.AAC.1